MDTPLRTTKSLMKRKYFYIILPTFIGSVIAYLDRCPRCGKWAGMKVKKIIEMPASPFNPVPYTVCHKQCSRCGHRRTIL